MTIWLRNKIRTCSGHLLIGFFVATLGACASVQPGGPMPGVAVTGQGANVLLQWTTDSPLATRLKSGRRFELLADYRSETGPVTGQFIANSGQTQGQSVIFELPGTINPVPLEQICLYIRMAGDSYPLPIRTAGGDLGTAGFRYAEWEQSVMKSSHRAALEAERAKLKSRISDVKRSLQLQEASGVDQGYSSEEACDSIRASNHLTKPRSVVEKDQHETVTKKICINRLANTARWVGLKSTFELLEIINSDLSKLPPKRTTQFMVLYTDWQEAGQLTSGTYQPELGTSADILPLANLKIDNREQHIAAILDAYGICREDVPKQLADELEAWSLAQKQEKQRAIRSSEYARNECRKHLTATASIRNELDKLTTHQQELDADILEQTSNPIPLAVNTNLQLEACRRK